MKKRNRKGMLWWLLLAVVVAILLGYVLKKELAQNHISPAPKATELAKGRQSKPSAASSTTQYGPASSEKGVQTPSSAQPAPAAAPLQVPSSAVTKKIDYCVQLEKDVMDFFSYLDRRPYVQHLELGKPVLDYSKDMMKQLSAYPPVPAGEGIDPRILTRNIYHLYRVLGLKGIRLVREILRNEQDSIEINLDILFRWVMAGDNCPDRLGLRPSFKILYKYAGFFVNTIGGRACLWRRNNRIRLLATYYCLLILHEADKRGLNSYGIDIYPLVISLKNEISHYHDLEFQPEYLNRLTKMENYYMERR